MPTSVYVLDTDHILRWCRCGKILFIYSFGEKYLFLCCYIIYFQLLLSPLIFLNIYNSYLKLIVSWVQHIGYIGFGFYRLCLHRSYFLFPHNSDIFFFFFTAYSLLHEKLQNFRILWYFSELFWSFFQAY